MDFEKMTTYLVKENGELKREVYTEDEALNVFGRLVDELYKSENKGIITINKKTYYYNEERTELKDYLSYVRENISIC